MALCTTANVKSYIGVSVSTHDTLIGLLIDSVSSFIETYTGRTYAAAEFTEYFDGNACEFILKNRPVDDSPAPVVSYNNGTQATPNWQVVSAEDYVINREAGIIVSTYGKLPTGSQNIKIVYTAGYATIPADLELLAKQLTAKAFEQRKAQGIGRESLGGASIDWKSELTPEQTHILSAYSNIVI